MSEPLICEYCGSKSKSKTLLNIHQKGVAKCINMQIKKLLTKVKQRFKLLK